MQLLFNRLCMKIKPNMVCLKTVYTMTYLCLSMTHLISYLIKYLFIAFRDYESTYFAILSGQLYYGELLYLHYANVTLL